ncbi:M20/M25/M40 family metallo-hydrolase [Dehalobacter sp. DCM]|uniref:M20/M25/M40 family metallo-hydrolase n=1 Tax=Dehalobacter sp. DCM TaxID=2907827 RepID=UPI0030821F02|nr:M20/M25/M40 family metallo-hydrolase [Dehalobacter sp. DCM]
MSVDVQEEFLKLVAFNSPSKQEGKLAEYLKRRLQDLGAQVHEDDSAAKTGSDTGNLIAVIPGNQQDVPVILLSAHMDTVASTEGMIPEIRNGIIYSDGQTILGADDKAGIAVILAVLSKIQENKSYRHGPIEVLLTVQEEIGLYGVKNLNYALQAAYGYILDGDGPAGTIVNAAPSHYTLDLVIEGKAAHAGLEPEAGINAIVVAAKAIAELKSGRIDEETTSNFGIISGGTARNVVAERVKITAEARSRNPVKLETEVRKILDQFKIIAENCEAHFSYEKELAYEGFTVDPEHPSITKLIEAGKRIGIHTELKPTGGGLDANILNSRGIPCLALGLGNDKPHTHEEFVDIRQMEKSVEWLLAALCYQ